MRHRHSTISDQGQRGTAALVQGFVLLAEMFGYINFLRFAIRGRGTFTMEFDHYEDMPASMVEKLMEKEAKQGFAFIVELALQPAQKRTRRVISSSFLGSFED